jgi:uncharacterized beta-barrel protein YwiB (DUF1934 family)
MTHETFVKEWRSSVALMRSGAVSMDILHFHARVLAVYGQRMFMGNL